MTAEGERVRKIFDRHVDAMRNRSVKWVYRGDGRRADRKIDKYLKYYCLPIDGSEVIALMDTTVFRTGKEGYLFTESGIIVKEVISKLYYLKFSEIARAEVLEERDEYYRVKSSVWVHFKDGTKKQIFDYYINKYTFVEYINDVIAGYGAKDDKD